MRVVPYGDRDLLVEVADVDEAVVCTRLLRDDPRAVALLVDVVPGARTVLLRARAGVGQADLAALVPSYGAVVAALGAGADGAVGASEAAEVVVPVVYDGPDLAEVAALTGLSTAEVVAAHTGTTWRAAFTGFAPGFAYLAGGDPRLQVPRRSAPRARVTAGAVGLAAGFCGVYPRASPGGWQLIGRTGAPLWDLERDPPALLRPGVAVRFEEVR